MRRAFTLIELLVVIAIIAILAAILFPVFAQAKTSAKKAADISNMKQITLSVLMYANDVDDQAPLTLPNNQMSFWTTPATRSTTTPTGLNLRQSFWSNSTQPYMKNYDLHAGPTQREWNLFNIAASTNPMRYSNGYILNTYLNAYSLTAVTSPTSTIMFWPGFGKDKSFGYASPYPLPYNKVTGWPVTGGTPWRYDGLGSNCVASLGLWGGVNPDYRVFADGFNLSRMDGHAKYVRAASPRSPWAQINTTNGNWASYWVTQDQVNTQCWHPAYFSPQFNLD